MRLFIVISTQSLQFIKCLQSLTFQNFRSLWPVWLIDAYTHTWFIVERGGTPRVRRGVAPTSNSTWNAHQAALLDFNKASVSKPQHSFSSSYILRIHVDSIAVSLVPIHEYSWIGRQQCYLDTCCVLYSLCYIKVWLRRVCKLLKISCCCCWFFFLFIVTYVYLRCCVLYKGLIKRRA